MANIQKRETKSGKIHFRVQISLKGYPKQTATFRNKTLARKWAEQTEAAIREGRHFKTAEAKKHTLNELINRYITQVIPRKKDWKKQKSQLTWWKKQLGDYLLSDITPALIAEQRDLLLEGTTNRGNKRSNSTVVRYLAALSHAFSIAMKEWGWIEDNPLRKVLKPKESRGRIRFLEKVERANLLEACKNSSNSYLYLIVVLALSTGMRYSEIINLTWADVDLIKSRITLHDTKNGEIRVVPITGLALNLLKDFEKIRNISSILLFPRQKGQNLQKPINLRTSWKKAVKEAEIKDFRFHDLRHCCASYLVMNGASSGEIAEVLGHKTLSMVKRYAHLSEAHTSKVVASMNEKIFGELNA
ncbi:MAG: Tyrosine recombinase XerC [Candidatus Anoxychlamydiales bacterium]|nr:Tyrosine recombinase XerC [Candidatus Anoxychlamydiales bacterium]